MQNQVITPEKAIAEFFEIRGDYYLQDGEIEEAVSEIGNPNADLPVVKTSETVADYISNGWEYTGSENGVLYLEREFNRTHDNRSLHEYISIADCGEFRLVFNG